MIEAKSVTKKFHNETAVRNINITVKRGSIYGLLGSNGAGKTTLLKMMAGIYRPETGTISIEDVPVFENVFIKKKVCYIPDTLYFFPQNTIAQMAEYYQNIYSEWDASRFNTLKRVFQIDTDRKIHKLSKGMQRQVAFWLALSCMPSVLILDEPIDGLDPVMRQKIKNVLFQDVADREMTVIISSHNLREIEDICDHIGIMHQGELIVEKELDDLKADTHKIQVAFKSELQEKHIVDQLEVVHQEKRGSVSVLIVKGEESNIKRIVRSEKPFVFDILPLTLEEMFIYEMGEVGYEIENILL
ncbi:ABC transporter ATP-binding protein [Alteribacillus iranensis]|uniref:ABC-2 type transport system ATP-binding protein n=1 Tax=Alteribacillus iranensis TaxID=930128 RepID=A0A1I2E0P7_9BACI|nr:ABC transporter ATP-binding protein [Alteribacillus iranensis]SFE86435.1 ABC-2 type transport system ATP-binding protein [Alteribacillus iranensis]